MAIFIDWLRKKHHYGRYAKVKGLVDGKGRKLLDIGCGAPAKCMKEGAFLSYIGHGEGIDLEPRKIDFPFKIGDIMEIPYGDKTFDVVTAIEVIEHIDNPPKAFREISRVLKDKGTFVMSTPTNNWLFTSVWFFWEKTFGREWHHTHLVDYNKNEWLELIKKSGRFRIKKVLNHWNVNMIVEMEKI